MLGLLLDEVGQELGFELSEIGFPVLLEDLGDFFSFLFFDDVVAVVEWESQVLVQFAADGGLAATHESDQQDIR